MRRDELVSGGRTAFDQRAWRTSYTRLAAADEEARLEAADLERLAIAAYLSGRAEESAEAWERAHQALLGQGDVARAVRCAFWLGLLLIQRGEMARGGGWISRAHGLVDDAPADAAERGYLLLPAALQALEGGDAEGARATFEEVAAVADRTGDLDLSALSRLGRGQALIAAGAAEDGVALLDEAMVAVTSTAVSPQVAGIVYCAVIIACRDIFDVRRAQEWTEALSRWCDAQEDLQPYRGQCLVHRSEILQLHGEWSDAMTEARRARDHMAFTPGDPAMGMAHYQQGELLRLRGAFSEAEQAYREASRWGHPVHPGLALLRLAQGRVADAEAAIRRVLAEAAEPVRRARVLAAYLEIVLAAGDVDAAGDAATELERLADDFRSPYLDAVACTARAAVAMAAGDARAAAVTAGRACERWQALEAPYEVALARLLLTRACHELGDHDTAELELDTALQVLRELGAAPAVAQAEALLRGSPGANPAGLTPRETEVLRLVARGATNREVAETLVISEKTVARHLSNTFTKLGVSSRAAATGYAYEHDLL